MSREADDRIGVLAHAAVTSTKLLPDEDPALLPGPDRVDTHRILSYRTPAARTPA